MQYYIFQKKFVRKIVFLPELVDMASSVKAPNGAILVGIPNLNTRNVIIVDRSVI